MTGPLEVKVYMHYKRSTLIFGLVIYPLIHRYVCLVGVNLQSSVIHRILIVTAVKGSSSKQEKDDICSPDDAEEENTTSVLPPSPPPRSE